MVGRGRPIEESEAKWRRFVVLFVAVFAGGLAAVLGLIVLLDPFDSGRFPALPIAGVSDDSQRTANVSLGRSANFNAAIFGNSHGQLLDPERLSVSTGLSFVQLTIPGANAPEQIAMLGWFIRHHRRIGAIVLAADERWCVEDPQPWQVFPFWLYDESNFAYLVNSLNTRPLTAAYRRVRFAFGLVAPSNPRGYDDYETGLPKDYAFDFPAAPSAGDGVPVSAIQLGNRPFPAIAQLAALLAPLPDTPLVILFPPQFYTMLPVTGYDAAVLKECKARFAHLVADAPRRGFLDFLVDTPTNRDPKNYTDLVHYRANVARGIEGQIADILNGRPAAPR
jgi:hypothetical protein